jgi:hypothetical protein
VPSGQAARRTRSFPARSSVRVPEQVALLDVEKPRSVPPALPLRARRRPLSHPPSLPVAIASVSDFERFVADSLARPRTGSELAAHTNIQRTSWDLRRTVDASNSERLSNPMLDDEHTELISLTLAASKARSQVKTTAAARPCGGSRAVAIRAARRATSARVWIYSHHGPGRPRGRLCLSTIDYDGESATTLRCYVSLPALRSVGTHLPRGRSQPFPHDQQLDRAEPRDATLAVRRTRVELPDDVIAPFEVFVNGVPQQHGKDYEQIGRSLVFMRERKQEGRLGFWRWTSILLGIAGTYPPDDWVDVVYDVDGQRAVKTRLPLAA